MRTSGRFRRIRLSKASGGGGLVDIEFVCPAGFAYRIRNLSLVHNDIASRQCDVVIQELPTDTCDEILSGATVAPTVFNYPGFTTSTLSVTSVEYMNALGKILLPGERIYATAAAMGAAKMLYLNLELEEIITGDGMQARL